MMNKSSIDEKKISDDVRYRLFKLVDAHPDMSQRELAKEMGISLGRLNYCLKAFIDVGLLKVSNFKRSSHKLGYVYLITPKGFAEKAQVTSRFLARKELEYKLLKEEIKTLRSEAKQDGEAVGFVEEP